MKNESLEQLANSTRLLVVLSKSNLELLQKVEIIEQIYSNLKTLKDEMGNSFEKEFGKLEKSVNDVIDKLSDPKLLKELINKIDEFVKAQEVAIPIKE